MTQKNLIFFILIAFCQHLNAQFLNVIKLDKEDTNLYDGINGMYIDEQGYKYIYNSKSIFRYDGFQWKDFQEIFPSLKNLISQRITCLYKDEDQLWYGTNNKGLFSIDEKGVLTSASTFLHLPNSNERQIRQITGLDNYLFVLTEYKLHTLIKKEQEWIPLNLIPDDMKQVERIFIHNELLWIAYDKGVANIDLKTKKVNSYKYKEATFFVDTHKKLWISHINEGTELIYYNTATKKFITPEFQPYPKYKQARLYVWLDANRLLSTPASINMLEVLDFKKKEKTKVDLKLSGIDSSSKLNDLLTDGRGRTWIVSNELYTIPRNRIGQIEHINQPQNQISDVLLSANRLMIAEADMGLIEKDRGRGTSIHYTTDNSPLFSNNIDLFVDFGDRRIGLVMENYFQLYMGDGRFDDPIELPGAIYSSYAEGNMVWLGGMNEAYRVNVLDKKVTILERLGRNGPVVAITSINSNYMGVVQRNFGTKIFEKHADSLNKMVFLRTILISGLKSQLNNSIALSPSKLLMVRATDHGLFLEKNPYYKFKGKDHFLATKFTDKRDFERIPTKARKFTNVVFLDENTIIATSPSAVYKLSIDGEIISVRGREDGLLNSEIPPGAITLDEDGILYIGGDKGVDKIILKQWQDYLEADGVSLKTIKFGGVPQKVADDKIVNIPHHVKTIDLELGYPHYFNSEEAVIQVRLDTSEEWSTLSNDNKLTLYNPKPGLLKPHFQAVSSEGTLLTKTFVFPMQVLQAWYKNPWNWTWMGALIFISVGGGIYFFQRKENVRVREQYRLKEELASLKLTSLNSQMNPHFIFNALSSIQQLITSADMRVAETYLSKFSKLLRHVIQYATLKKVRLSDELEFIRNYLDLELLRFTDAFTYEIHSRVDNAEEVYVPPFFLQPQVENALKHGFADESIANRLLIKVEERDGIVKIIVEDNGRGREAAANSPGYFRTNTKKGNLLTEDRIENLNKLNYYSTYSIEDLYDNGHPVGTRVILEFDQNQNKINE